MESYEDRYFREMEEASRKIREETDAELARLKNIIGAPLAEAADKFLSKFSYSAFDPHPNWQDHRLALYRLLAAIKDTV